ncbi:hypothetical protein NDU88_000149 [Pleurodeles waltl]|uniref:Uncharacterized protein n=1 Tax=Pleurodeles waltl TaxID=8319 RepID=A0AAV7S3R7_PLEWA|nr:hypothetical protein NDU88_000149 [Pleurodeles waltl]
MSNRAETHSPTGDRCINSPVGPSLSELRPPTGCQNVLVWFQSDCLGLGEVGPHGPGHQGLPAAGPILRSFVAPFITPPLPTALILDPARAFPAGFSPPDSAAGSSLPREQPGEFHVSSAASSMQPQPHPESLTGARLSLLLPNSARGSELRSGPAGAFLAGFPPPVSAAGSSLPREQPGEFHVSSAASGT